MLIELNKVGPDTWQARRGDYRYQIRYTGTTQHGPWFLDIYGGGVPAKDAPKFLNQPSKAACEELIAKHMFANDPGVKRRDELRAMITEVLTNCGLEVNAEAVHHLTMKFDDMLKQAAQGPVA